MAEADSCAKYRVLPPNFDGEDMVIVVDTKMAAVEYHDNPDPEGDDRPPRLVIW